MPLLSGTLTPERLLATFCESTIAIAVSCLRPPNRAGMSSSIVLRSSLRALRTLAPIARPLATPMLRAGRPAPAFRPWARPGMVVCAQRWYSSGGTLAKDDIQRRIIEILQGFDKVTDPSKVLKSRKPFVLFSADLGDFGDVTFHE